MAMKTQSPSPKTNVDEDEHQKESYLQFVARKLITKEDPLHLHKVLGILALVSYAWRFSMVGDDDMGFFKYPQWTLPTLFLHLCLNLSSFEFVLPKQRIKDGGRIWPEYRMHAAIFLSRSLIAVFWRCRQASSSYTHAVAPNFYFFNWCLIMANMFAADMATRSVGKYASQSIRHTEAPLFFKYYSSGMQFMGTAFILGSRRVTIPFYYAFVVQLNPFCMTMVRKGIIPHRVNIFLYVAELAGGIYLGVREGYNYETPHVGLSIMFILGMAPIAWRMGPWPSWVPRNKYLIWTTMYVLLETVLRPIKDAQPVVYDFDTLSPIVHNIRWVGDVFMFSLIAWFSSVAVLDASKRLWNNQTIYTKEVPLKVMFTSSSST